MMKQMLKRTLKRTLAVLLTALLVAGAAPAAGIAGIASLLSVTAAAETGAGSCGADGSNVTWSLDTETGVLTISGTGAMKGYSSSQVPWYSYRSSVKAVTIGSGVTKIGMNAFYGCSNLTSVTIPDGMRSIDMYAFRDCMSLTSITIPDSVTSISTSAFRNCTSITVFTVGESNKGFSSDANGVLYNKNKTTLLFYPVGNTRSALVIPNSVTSISSNAFYGCSNLTNVTIPDGVTSIGSSAFEGCTSLASVTIPDGVTSIGSSAFEGCTSLASVTIPDGVTSIGDSAFSGCTSLTSVTIPDSVTSIGNSAFAYCTSLASVTIPDSVTSIGNYAFSGCTNLASVTIPDGVTSIGWSTFSGCTNLASVTIPDGVTSIGNSAFSGCTNLASVTIPDSVTSIGSSAFSFCTSLASVTIPYGVTSIGSSAFFYCTGLANITIGSGVTSIGNNAFYNCTSLANVTIGSGVTSIGDSAFSGVLNIIYSGSASGSPWGAEYVNKYAEGDLIFETAQKTMLLSCRRNVQGDITIPDSVTYIGNSAFSGCTGLTGVTIPDGVQTIDQNAFSGCTGLTSIAIPNNVTYIGDGAFFGVLNIIYSGSASGSPWGAEYVNKYAEGDLIFETAQKTMLLSCRRNVQGDVTIPDSVTSIGSSAFSYCTGLANITIGSGVTSIGSSAFSYCTGLANITIGSGVTSIGDSAFYGCTGLANITIGSGVTSIGSSAFSGCTSLASVTIPYGATSIGNSAFSGCTNLASVTIPDSVTSIGSRAFTKTAYYNDKANWTDGVLYIGRHLIEANTTLYGNYSVIAGTYCIASKAFYNCIGLTSLTIPDSVTSIGEYAFRDCTSLASVTIGSGVTSIDQDAFYGCTGLTSVTFNAENASFVPDSSSPFCDRSALKTVVFGDAVKVIPAHIFKNCPSLTNVTIPDSATSIGDSAFSGCSNLTSVTIPDSVTSIGDGAFSGCTSLANVTIPDSVTSIDNYAFSGCTSLASVTIPDSVTSIGEYAFRGCASLASVTIGSGLTSINPYVFTGCTSLAVFTVDADNTAFSSDADGVLYNKDKTELIRYPAGNARAVFAIPDSVTSIGNYAFSGCTNLASVTIPDSVTSIGNSAFSGCTNLASVTIPDGVTSISYRAFEGCTSLVSVTIPDSVTSIGGAAFLDCWNLTSVTIPDSVTSIGENAFYNCTSLANVTIGSGVTSIGMRAFAACAKLASVTIPDSVTSIGDNAFYNCTSLANVTIGSGVTTIGRSAFSGCTSLAIVCFGGNPQIYYGNDPLESATRYYHKHNEQTETEVRNAVAATCLTDGYSGDVVYLPCGVCKQAGEVLPALGTEHCWNSGEVTEPTCTTGGYTTYICTRCGETYTDNETPARGHTFGEPAWAWAEDYSFASATLTCSSCGGSWTLNAGIDMTILSEADCGHDRIILYSAAAELDGIIYSDTTREITMEGTALGHDYNADVTAPTCTETGCTTYTCTRCGDSYVVDETAALGHNFSAWAVVREATYYTDGEESRTCARCGMIETRAIPKKPIPTVTVEDITVTLGSTAQLHPVVENVDFAYTLQYDAHDSPVLSVDDNGTITPLQYGMATVTVVLTGSTDLSVCAECRVTVRGIQDGIFEYADASKTVLVACDRNATCIVTVPDGVTRIDENAFYKCENLTEAILPQSLTEIGESAFAGCGKLERITIPGSVKTIGEQAFTGDFRLAEITLENGVETIGEYAFAYCGTTSIHIPASVRTIEDGALVGAIANKAYNPTPTLREITVDEDSPYFTAVDGVLYTKDGTELVQYPAAKTDEFFVIPDGVTLVRLYAFLCVLNLEKLVFPESAALFGDDFSGLTFERPANLPCTVYFPQSMDWVQRIEKRDCVTVAVMTDIAVRAKPEKTNYIMGDALDLTGLALDAVYDNGETLPLPYDVELQNTSLDTVGMQTVTMSYGGCTADFAVRVLPNPDAPAVCAADAVVGCSAGRLVRVPVTLRNNPGVIATRLYIGYDTQQLRLVGVDNGDVFGDAAFLSGGDLSAEPYTVLWSDDDARTDNTADGTLVTLTFEVQPTATVGETVVTVTYDADSTFNAALQFAQLYTSDGTVSVVDCTPGDASRDGKISLLDSVMLTRYLADGWDVTISEVNADVNGDAVLDLKDVVLIRRCLAGGWDAVLI